MAVSQITMRDLHSKLGNLSSGEIILDVRSSDEFRAGHVPGSMNIPHDQVASHAERLKSYSKIYVHCQAGGRAGKAVEALSRLGLNNLICVSGSGMGDWISAGYPVEK
jgi:rhodanese-related sulfurtransferase